LVTLFERPLDVGRQAIDSESGLALSDNLSRPLPFSTNLGLMVEKRVFPRRRVLKAGTIEFDGGQVNCMVRDMSNVGAALNTTSPVGIPNYFTLVFPADGQRIPCHIVWRGKKRIGVAFD
jgi:PilZ domain